MGAKSRRKGAEGERELSRYLKEWGYDARRGQQYCGANGDADVIGLDGYHIECKRVESLRLYDSLEQSRADAREGEVPVVFHRKNRKPWVVIMEADEFLRLLQHLK